MTTSECHTESRPIGVLNPENSIHRVDVAQIVKEAVRHPNHYCWHPTCECIEVTQHFNFNLGNVIKYVWRAGAPVPKESVIQDLQKAKQYIDFELKRLGAV